MNGITISVKNGYTMFFNICYYNEVIQVSGNTIWTIQLTTTKSWCTEFP